MSTCISPKSIGLIRFVPCLLIAMGLVSCGKQTVQDNLSQQMDRDRSSASLLTNQYRVTEGTYITDASLDQSKYWFSLQVKVVSVQATGSSVPVPTLVGAFQSWNKSAGAQAATMQNEKAVTFPFSYGTFDPGTSLLALTLSSASTNTIYVSCNVQNKNSLLCSWIPTGGQVQQFSFVMKKI